MNAPFAYSTETPNNQWMHDMTPEERALDLPKAFSQFLELYRFLAGEAFVQILPTPFECGLQDLVFTANLAFIPEHLIDDKVVIISNFSSPPRKEETGVGVDFFTAMGYAVHVCPYRFEGEAELKHLHGNVYIGGYGERSSIEAYRWMENAFSMRIIDVKQTDPYSYHLDGCVFPIDDQNSAIATDLLSDEELRSIAKVTNIVPVDNTTAKMGGCNSLILGEHWLNGTVIEDLGKNHQLFESELHKNTEIERIASEYGKKAKFFNLGEYLKGGACLSCLVMHLNRKGMTCHGKTGKRS